MIKLSEEFNKYFKMASSRVHCIPSADVTTPNITAADGSLEGSRSSKQDTSIAKEENPLLSLDEAVGDRVRFFSKFPVAAEGVSLPYPGGRDNITKRLADYSLDMLEEFRHFGTIFDHRALVKELPKLASTYFSQPAENLRLLQYLVALPFPPPTPPPASSPAAATSTSAMASSIAGQERVEVSQTTGKKSKRKKAMRKQISNRALKKSKTQSSSLQNRGSTSPCSSPQTSQGDVTTEEFLWPACLQTIPFLLCVPFGHDEPSRRSTTSSNNSTSTTGGPPHSFKKKKDIIIITKPIATKETTSKSIVTKHITICTPAEAYIEDKTYTAVQAWTCPSCLLVPVVHKTISEAPSLRRWLRSELLVKSFNPEEVVKAQVLPALGNQHTKATTLIALTRFLFVLFNRERQGDRENQRLKLPSSSSLSSHYYSSHDHNVSRQGGGGGRRYQNKRAQKMKKKHGRETETVAAPSISTQLSRDTATVYFLTSSKRSVVKTAGKLYLSKE